MGLHVPSPPLLVAVGHPARSGAAWDLSHPQCGRGDPMAATILLEY